MPLAQTVQAVVCLGHFINIDVYQRGLYKLQCRLYKRSHRRSRSGDPACRKRIDAVPLRIIHSEEFLGHLPPALEKTVFVSSTFNLTTQRERIPLLCGAVFEATDIFCDSGAPDEETCAYLEVQLFFSPDEASADPDRLELQQTRTIKINDFMSTRTHVLEHISVTFDGVFFSTCDIAVATVPLRFVPEAPAQPGSSAHRKQRQSSQESPQAHTQNSGQAVVASIFSSLAGILGAPWHPEALPPLPDRPQAPAYPKKSDDIRTSSSTASIHSTGAPQSVTLSIAEAVGELPIHQLMCTAISSISVLLDLHVATCELMQDAEAPALPFAIPETPVSVITQAIRSSLPRLDSAHLPLGFAFPHGDQPVSSRAQATSLLALFSGMLRKWINVEVCQPYALLES
nr:hypothetical protein HK105_003132 [Polyrhizophydium stewartii]